MSAHVETTEYEGERTLEALLTIADVGRLLGISRGHVYTLIRSGELPPPVRVGARTRFVPAEIREYVERHRTRAAVP